MGQLSTLHELVESCIVPLTEISHCLLDLVHVFYKIMETTNNIAHTIYYFYKQENLSMRQVSNGFVSLHGIKNVLCKTQFNP